MRTIVRWAALLIVGVALNFGAEAAGPTFNARYSWMLPKTVIDATIVYTLDKCEANSVSVKITPTLAPRAVPDVFAGEVETMRRSWTPFGRTTTSR